MFAAGSLSIRTTPRTKLPKRMERMPDRRSVIALSFTYLHTQTRGQSTSSSTTLNRGSEPFLDTEYRNAFRDHLDVPRVVSTASERLLRGWPQYNMAKFDLLGLT